MRTNTTQLAFLVLFVAVVDVGADNTCSICKHVISMYYGQRFTQPYFLWKDTSAWPISKHDACDQFSGERARECETFFDSTSHNPLVATNLAPVLKNGCIENLVGDCPRKWIGVCDPHLACTCLSLCEPTESSPVGECLGVCEDSFCTNCEKNFANSNRSPACSMCEVNGVMYGATLGPV
eukprot:c9311_g1_i1.p1 GENE.c9311_g1_i1~~c9311_g1_i1.p1  ORF type:complete len:201 (+),score=33.59 c9311_g1_i1:65-604(+)